MLEQDIASIIKFVLDKSGNPAPYYYNVPRSFAVPAAYFPVPKITTGGETFSTYRMEYDWFIKFFHRTTEKAYAKALQALTAILDNRNLIPLIDSAGEQTSESLRIEDPTIETLDDGAVQLKISFTCRHPYYRPEVEKMQHYDIANWTDAELYKSKTVNDAMEMALEQYIKKNAPDTQPAESKSS